MDAIKQTVKISNDQIAKFKDDITRQTKSEIEEYCLKVYAIEEPQREMQMNMKRLQQQMEALTEECNDRKVQQDVMYERIALAFTRIQGLQDEKISVKEHYILEDKVWKQSRDANAKFEQVEKALRESIDYMVRYQWKETRNIVNQAMSAVIRPL